MSFGFSVGDFLVVGQLCWNVYRNCKDSSGHFKDLSAEVGSLHNVFKETEELLSQQQLSPEQQSRLQVVTNGSKDLLHDLDALLKKYESLGTKSQRTWDRVGFGMQDVTNLRFGVYSRSCYSRRSHYQG